MAAKASLTENNMLLKIWAQLSVATKETNIVVKLHALVKGQIHSSGFSYRWAIWGFSADCFIVIEMNKKHTIQIWYWGLIGD